MFKMIFFIFHILITFYENFMKLIYQENHLLSDFLIIFYLKFMYLHINIYESMINRV